MYTAENRRGWAYQTFESPLKAICTEGSKPRPYQALQRTAGSIVYWVAQQAFPAAAELHVRRRRTNAIASGKGGLFNIGYWRLSYRSRFLYDLWMTPIGAALAAGIDWWWFRPADLTGYWFIGLLVLIGVASAVNNYIRLQAQARREKSNAAADRGRI